MWLQDFNCPIYGGCGLQASLEVLRSTEDIEQLRHQPRSSRRPSSRQTIKAKNIRKEKEKEKSKIRMWNRSGMIRMYGTGGRKLPTWPIVLAHGSLARPTAEATRVASLPLRTPSIGCCYL
jgi:hypothetical protein